MLENYFRSALRNFARGRATSAINTICLAVGIASFTIIYSYIAYQYSFDRYNKKLDLIYRLTSETRFSPNAPYIGYAQVEAGIAKLIKPQFPEVSAVVRMCRLGNRYVTVGDRRFSDKGIVLSDSSISKVFTFHLVKGSWENALDDPRSIVITRSVSLKYFGSVNSVGRTLEVDNGRSPVEFDIGAVIDDVPGNSHFDFDMLIPFADSKEFAIDSNAYCFTYLTLRRKADAAVLRVELPKLAEEYTGEVAPRGFKFRLQPLRDIHLHSHLRFEWKPNADIANIHMLFVIGLLVLLVAGTNFTGISISQYVSRRREVGVRKVMGATRLALIVQFLVESAVTAALGTLSGIGMAELALPLMTNIVGEGASTLLSSPGSLAVILMVGITVAILSGVYPVLYLGSLSPTVALRRESMSWWSKMTLRKAFVVFQFAVSTGLLIAAVIIERQFEFMENKNLGFDKSEVVVVPISSPRQYSAFRHLLSEKPGIADVGAAAFVPGEVQGTMFVKDPRDDRSLQMRWNSIDGSFLRTIRMKVTDGKGFSKIYPSSLTGFLINQKAAAALGWRIPVGHELIAARDTGRVIGIVEDVYFSSLRHEIGPTLYWYRPSFFSRALIRVAPGDYSGHLREIRSAWNQVSPESPFEYHFLDTDIDMLYRSEKRLGLLFAMFGGLGVLVGSLGLFGLASFTIQRRTKEIGIRKVLGGPTVRIMIMLSGDFLILVGFANVIAWPVAYIIMQNWLHNYAYRVGINLLIFPLVGALMVCLSLAAILIRVLRAARTNPVEALRNE